MVVGAWESVSGWCCPSSHAVAVNGGGGGIRLTLGSTSRPYGVCDLNRLHRLKGWGKSGDCHEML